MAHPAKFGTGQGALIPRGWESNGIGLHIGCGVLRKQLDAYHRLHAERYRAVALSFLSAIYSILCASGPPHRHSYWSAQIYSKH